jgi:hypothetical protein
MISQPAELGKCNAAVMQHVTLPILSDLVKLQNTKSSLLFQQFLRS